MSNVDEGMNATVKTIIFVVVMAVVLGLFFYLSSLDRPPHMPAGITHTLRISTQAKLIGLGPEKVDPRTGRPVAIDDTVQYDEKMVEERVNATCTQCHGVPAQDNANHPCQKRTGKCVPKHHPPKLTCIKCHRQKNPGKDPKPGEPVVNMPLFPMPTADAAAADDANAAKDAAKDAADAAKDAAKMDGKGTTSDGGPNAKPPSAADRNDGGPKAATAQKEAAAKDAAPAKAPAAAEKNPSKAAP